MKTKVNGVILGLVFLIALAGTMFFVIATYEFNLEAKKYYDLTAYYLKTYALGIITFLLIGAMYWYYSKNISRSNFILPIILIIAMNLVFATPILMFLNKLELYKYVNSNLLTLLLTEKLPFVITNLFLGSTIIGLIKNEIIEN